jgi:hypothetical protein
MTPTSIAVTSQDGTGNSFSVDRTARRAETTWKMMVMESSAYSAKNSFGSDLTGTPIELPVPAWPLYDRLRDVPSNHMRNRPTPAPIEYWLHHFLIHDEHENSPSTADSHPIGPSGCGEHPEAAMRGRARRSLAKRVRAVTLVTGTSSHRQSQHVGQQRPARLFDPALAQRGARTAAGGAALHGPTRGDCLACSRNEACTVRAACSDPPGGLPLPTQGRPEGHDESPHEAHASARHPSNGRWRRRLLLGVR